MITFFSSYSVPQLQGIEVNAVVIENLFHPHMRKRLVCQKSVMSSQRRKGKVCRGSVLAGSWAVYRWLQEQKHPPWVPCHTAVLWCDFTSILVNFEFGASCPVLLLDGTIHQMDSVVVLVLQCVRREDSTSDCLRSLGFLQFLVRVVSGGYLFVTKASVGLSWPVFFGWPRLHLTIIHASEENCKTDN